MTVDLLTYGETMGLLDADRIGPLRLGGPLRLSMAGAESTVAIGVARLGGSARWVGTVGDDEIGVLITRADIVLATAEEATLLVDGPQDDGRIREVPPFPADVIDPVGAGDAFAAGLLADLALGHPAARALETAASVAAVKLACPGDWEGLPTRADLHQLRR